MREKNKIHDSEGQNHERKAGMEYEKNKYVQILEKYDKHGVTIKHFKQYSTDLKKAEEEVKQYIETLADVVAESEKAQEENKINAEIIAEKDRVIPAKDEEIARLLREKQETEVEGPVKSSLSDKVTLVK